jgi:hypothetical protein
MGHSDLRKIENKSGSGDVRTTPYAFSLDVKLRKPEEVTGEDPAAAAAVAAGGADLSGSADGTGTEQADAETAPPGSAATAPDAPARATRTEPAAGAAAGSGDKPSVTDMPLPPGDTASADTTTGGTP